MRYQHRDGEAGTGAVSLTAVRDKARVDSDGTFTVDEDRDDFEDVHESLVNAGHQPIDDAGDDVDDEGASVDTGTDEDVETETETDGEVEAEADTRRASDYSETELVEMGRNELRAIAAGYDDVDGNASADALTEALIEKRREEVDGDGS